MLWDLFENNKQKQNKKNMKAKEIVTVKLIHCIIEWIGKIFFLIVSWFFHKNK